MTDKNNYKKPKKIPLQYKLVVGAIAGAFGTTCIFPIDMIKTRLQSSNGVYFGPIDAFKKIVSNEGGYRALYRGLGINLVGVTPEKAIKLSANEFFREALERPDGSISLVNEVIAAAGAGIVQVIATNPMEISKIRMQTQMLLPANERQSTIEMLRSLGIRGLYSGTLATLLRDVPFSVLFFPSYANLKLLVADKNGNNSFASLLFAGGIAGALAAGAVTPTDVIKTRLQLKGGKEKYKDIPTAFRMVLRDEGPIALFKGAVPRMGVVGSLFAITLLAFETQKKYMIKYNLL